MGRASLAVVDEVRSVTHQRGAYAVILDSAGHVLVVKAENGRCYLPGGRIEPGESPPQALLREIAEECGWSAEIGTQLRQCSQTIFAGRVLLEAFYWRANLTAPLDQRREHEMLWLDPVEASACLHRTGDRAALDDAARVQPQAS